MPEQEYKVQPFCTLGVEWGATHLPYSDGDIVKRSSFLSQETFDRFVEVGSIKPVFDPATQADILRQLAEAQNRIAELQSQAASGTQVKQSGK